MKESPQSSQQLLSHVQKDPVQTRGALYVKCRTPWHASDPTALVLGLAMLTGPGSFQLSKGDTSHHSEVEALTVIFSNYKLLHINCSWL